MGEVLFGKLVGKYMFIALDIPRDKSLVCEQIENFVSFLVRWITNEDAGYPPRVEFVRGVLRVVGKG